MNDTAIKIEGLYKQYHLGTIGYGTLIEDIQSWWARVRGKEDPNLKVTDSPAGKNIPNFNESSFWALRDINLDIKHGEIVGIIGRNGAGKSTLLKLISKITNPTKGTIKINGRVSSILEIGTGFHGELSGRENIYLSGTILGMKKKEIDRKIDEIIDFSEIEKFIDTPVKRYSSGMYVRLAFAVVANLESEILILDEVLAVGDAAFQKKCLGKVGQISTKEGRTVLFVSHNMGSIQSLCNRGVLLNQGAIISDGQVNDVVDKYVLSYIDNSKLEIHYPQDDARVMQLNKVSLLDENNKLSSEIDRKSSFKIIIDYEVREENEGAHVTFSLDKIGNASIQAVCDTDFIEGHIVKREKGKYRFTATYPGGILNAGVYQIRPAVAKYGGIVYHEDNEGIIFSLVDKGTFASFGDHGKQRSGLLVMDLENKTERL